MGEAQDERKKMVPQLTRISAYGARGNEDSWVFSSSAASIGTVCWLPSFNISFCDNGGMPVTGSSFAFSWPMVHEGVTRRSEEAFSELTRSGMSPAVCMLIVEMKVVDLLLVIQRQWVRR